MKSEIVTVDDRLEKTFEVYKAWQKLTFPKFSNPPNPRLEETIEYRHKWPKLEGTKTWTPTRKELKRKKKLKEEGEKEKRRQRRRRKKLEEEREKEQKKQRRRRKKLEEEREKEQKKQRRRRKKLEEEREKEERRQRKKFKKQRRQEEQKRQKEKSEERREQREKLEARRKQKKQERQQRFFREHPERIDSITKFRNKRIFKELNNRMSQGILGSLKGRNTHPWENLVDYTINELRERLNTTMPAGYTWQDFFAGSNSLHIDHIIPKNVFNFIKPEDEDFKRCWALKNLRLLPVFQNLSKHAKISEPFQPTFIFERTGDKK